MKKYSTVIICILGTAAVIASYFIIFSPGSGEKLFKTGKGGDIIIDGEAAGNEAQDKDADDQKSDPDEALSTADSEESEAILEKLSAVEGLSLRKDTGYIFVGDSRFVAMNTVCGISKTDNLFMVAKVGEGYSWFNSTALQQIKRIVSSGLFNKWKIIICLGINDLGNLSKYLEKYESIKDDYDITLVSVNPVDHYGNLSNQQIKDFNEGLKSLSIPYIDTFSILADTGYKTTDGLHYSEETGRKIYNGILLGLKDSDPEALTADGSGILDKGSLSKKNSIQSDITAQNKYVKKEAPAAVSSNATDQALIEEFLRMQEENPVETVIPEKQGTPEEPYVEEAPAEIPPEEEPQEEEVQEEEHLEEENDDEPQEEED